MPADPRTWIRWAVLAGALILGVWLRLRGLAGLPLYGDEHHTLLLADESYGNIMTTFDAVGSHVPLPLVQRLSMDVLGPGIVPFRLVAIVPGLVFLALAYPVLTAFVGRSAAALATVALAVNPMVVYYARFARGYALALLLALVLGWTVRRLLALAGHRRATWAALIGSAALLPWVHLSALGFVLAVALAGIGLAWRESRALALRIGLAFAAAAGLSALLFVPVAGEVVDYFREMEPEPAPLAWFGVPTLLAGGRVAAVAWLVLLPLGAALLWREQRKSVVLTAASLLGPLALLLATQPRGLDYAWARYLLSALPFVAAVCAAGLVGVARLLPRAGETAALLAGTALCLAQHWTGPIGPRAPQTSFSNTYLAMHRLPAFDVPWPDAPELYGALADDASVERIVEAPTIQTRGVLAYRNHALRHGKPVLLGWTGEMPRGIRRGPYRRLLELGPDDAEVLVLHRDQSSEVPAYFRFVYENVWPRIRRRADESFMLRQESIFPDSFAGAELTALVTARLEEEYGPPDHADERILVWRFVP